MRDHITFCRLPLVQEQRSESSLPVKSRRCSLKARMSWSRLNRPCTVILIWLSVRWGNTVCNRLATTELRSRKANRYVGTEYRTIHCRELQVKVPTAGLWSVAGQPTFSSLEGQNHIASGSFFNIFVKTQSEKTSKISKLSPMFGQNSQILFKTHFSSKITDFFFNIIRVFEGPAHGVKTKQNYETQGVLGPETFHN